MKEIVLKAFREVFGDDDEAKLYFAPGRVNLIGEHTDYNGGHVFPCALTFGTYAAARKREDSRIRLYSKNFDAMGIVEFDRNSLEYMQEHGWANYPKGVVKFLRDYKHLISSGFEVLFFGNIPNGAGLSSSASIELVTGVMLRDLFKLDIDMIDMVKLCKDAENKFIGMNCGIMDQFIIGMGKRDNAVLLDTNTLKYQYVGLELDDISIVISNTNKQRKLSESKYNERRSQCEEALRDLQVGLNIKSLGEINEEEFEKNRHLIKNPINIKRARHAVYENGRTIKAVEALEMKDIDTFGRLMNESHVSLRDDYEVTGKELDTLVSLAWKQNGVIGSRMTGAGFGGCTVSLVRNEFIEEFIKNVGDNYLKEIGYNADFYIAKIGDGARKL